MDDGVSNLGEEITASTIGGNWLYIDNLRIGNLEDTWSRSPTSEEVLDNRIFDLFGREKPNQVSLKTGVYIQNNKLIFINNNY